MEVDHDPRSTQSAGFTQFDFPTFNPGESLHLDYAQDDILEDLSNVYSVQPSRSYAGIQSEASFIDDNDLLGSGSQYLSNANPYSNSYAGYSSSSHTPVPQADVSLDYIATTAGRLTNYVRNLEDPYIPGRVPGAPQSQVQYYPPGQSGYLPNQASQEFEISSLVNSQQDSGYHSSGHHLSVPSAYSQSFIDSRSFQGPFCPSIDMTSTPESQPGDAQHDAEQSAEPIATQSSKSRSSRGGRRTCPSCAKVLKCPSDFKKHMLTHDKPHKCDVPGCNRTEGFGTTNDLDRHKASVHKILSSVSRKWQCAAPNCKQPEKVWPRLDNFKQHLDRMHKGVDLPTIIEASEIRPGQNSSTRNLDSDLGGVGTGAGFSGPHASYSIPQYSGRTDRIDYANVRRDNGRLQALSSIAEVHQRLRDTNRVNEEETLELVAKAVRGILSTPAASSESGRSRKLLQDISSIMASQEDDRSTQITRATSDTETSTGGHPIRCPKCPRTFNRKCDLRKHEKRHSKPYVCTATECRHRSGSKYDWQRHEYGCNQRGKECVTNDTRDTMRVCLEMDRTTTSGKCGFTHTSDDFFTRHLKDAHKIVDEQTILNLLDDYNMKLEPGSGWCGFCLEAVHFSENPSNIGDNDNVQDGYGKHHARADHIDVHVSKEGRNMDQYVSLEYHLKNEAAEPSKFQVWFNAQVPGNNDPRTQNPDYKPPTRKRKYKGEGCASDEDERRKKMNEAKWSCCQCENYQLIKVHLRCVDCQHERCASCDETNDRDYTGILPQSTGTEVTPQIQIQHEATLRQFQQTYQSGSKFRANLAHVGNQRLPASGTGLPDRNMAIKRKKRQKLLAGPWDSRGNMYEINGT